MRFIGPFMCNLALAWCALGFNEVALPEVSLSESLNTPPGTASKTVDSLFDVFPLRPGLQFTYDYYFNSSYSETVLWILSVDSGSVEYVVRDSLHENDTIISWNVEERHQLWHRRFDLFNHRDSLYWTYDTLAVPLREVTSGRHELTGKGLIWNFPFTALRGDPYSGWWQPIYRFADSPEVIVANDSDRLVLKHSLDSLRLSDTSGVNRIPQSYGWGEIDFGTSTLIATLRGRILTGMQKGIKLPRMAELFNDYPNPFNPSTTIRYALPTRVHVTLTVFNTLGQQVATLVNETQDAGYHDVRFDGSGLASGVYLYRLTAGDFVETKKLLLLH